MIKNNRYPQIKIRSKNELAKRISSKNFPQDEALKLINDCLNNFDNYWKDSKKSEPEKQKYVRSAYKSPLDKLLKLIDRKILKPHDLMLPNFIFGGVSGRNHLKASFSLLGKKRKRTLLKMDISRFFEQIKKDRIVSLFHNKCNCSYKASVLLADLCCVPKGPKGITGSEDVLARGFPTSSRLSVWTNLDIFLKLDWNMKKNLKKNDPRLAIFVDDIGLSASRVDNSQMQSIKDEFKDILEVSDKNQKLKINNDKTSIIPFEKGVENLGLRLGRNKIGIGKKTQSKMNRVKSKLKNSSGKVKKKNMLKNIAYKRYEQQIHKINGIKQDSSCTN